MKTTSRAVALLTAFAMLPAGTAMLVAEPGRSEAPPDWPQLRGPEALLERP